MHAAILVVVGSSLAEPLRAQDEQRFIRADANQDGRVDLSDPIATLLHLFQPGFTVPCEKAADADDSGGLDITDAIYSVSFLFSGGTAPPAPFPACGVDSTADGLSCADAACPSGGSGVIISEILASNDETLVDEDGEASDWIELHLPSDASDPVLDLGGFSLTTRTDLGRLWRIPNGTTIERGGFLVIFASGKNRTDPGGELHTDFKLAREGEYLALVGPDGATIFDEFFPTFPEQLVDISYGRAQSSASLVVDGATARYRVPTSGDSGLGTSWTELGFADGAWKSGPTGIGFTGITTQGFKVTYYKASVNVDHLTTAEQVIRTPQMQSQVVHDTAEFIDYYNTGGRGNYGNDEPFPGLSFADVDHFVIVAEGTVHIPQAGAWSFGVNSDDGFSLELENGGQTFDMEFAAPRGPSDTIQVFNIPRAGPWNLRLLYYEQGGGAGVELFAAPGSRPSFDSRFFRLVGDTANGGLGLVGFADEIKTNVEGDMRNVNASIWMRLPFEVEDPQALGGLALEIKYADGFVAFLNGNEVASRNAPATLAWNSQATDERSLEEAALVESINLTDHISLLEPGQNVLAIHGLNDTASDSDFLIVPRLTGAGQIAEDQYMTTPTPGAFNVPGASGFIREVQFSEPHGFYEDELSLELSTDTPGTQIRFTLDGSTPTKTHGTVYSGPITISRTTVVRAAAFREGYIDSRPKTQSYLFLSDIIRQSPSGQSPGPGWPTGSVNGQVLDYGMDPDIVNHAVWSSQIEGALLSIPSIVISTDVANLFSSSTGIYVNAGNDGRAWERPVSAELIYPDGKEGFSVNAGLRIRGAFSRSDGNPKHSFRLFFRKEYGPGRLQYPLFGGEGADEFDKIDLRTSQNYSWAFEGSEKNTFMREVFSRDVQRDMNQPHTRTRYYHLYLNGQYWGLYMTQERVDAVYAETYFGGAEADYDVIKNDSSGSRALEASDGTIDAYRALYEAAVAGFSSDTAYYRIQGLRTDGTPDPNGRRLVDVENLMDYMVCTYYTGDPDAPVSAWAHFSNNIFAVYNRNRKDGFKWFRHDAEHSLGANGGLFEGRLLTDPVDRSIGQQWQHFNPAWLHLRLTAHPEYALAFADRVVKHFFNGGVLSAQANIARWNARKAQIEQAVIAASARWGDSKRHPPRTKNDWLQESNWVTGTFFPQRNQIVINQMRSVDMFPDTGIVTFNQPGGRVDSGFEVLLSQSNGNTGTIYYTTDGVDPRMRGGSLYSGAAIYTSGSPIRIDESTTVKARVRAGSEWGALSEARFVVGLDSLVVNEVMAANSATLEDPDEPGEYPDWIELYNGTDNTIDLGGMYLSDDPLDLKHWRIPDGLTIGPGEFLVFFADDDGTQGPLHTNFQLSQSGEVVLLVDTDGSTIIDLMVFDQQIEDVSFGRFPDGTDELGFHTLPTPGSANRSHAE